MGFHNSFTFERRTNSRTEADYEEFSGMGVSDKQAERKVSWWVRPPVLALLLGTLNRRRVVAHVVQ
jgi:hypothetical protein